MQPSEILVSAPEKPTIKVVHKNYEGKVCYNCGTALLQRKAGDKILPGRFFCPNCKEGDGEYITSHSFFVGQIPDPDIRSMPQGPFREIHAISSGKPIPANLQSWLWDYAIVRTSLIRRKTKLTVTCENCSTIVTDKFVISYLTNPYRPHEYLHISCAQKIGLELSEEDTKEVTA